MSGGGTLRNPAYYWRQVDEDGMWEAFNADGSPAGFVLDEFVDAADKTDDAWVASHRYDQCDVTCTTYCGHCKGDPVGALRRDLHALARRLATRFEENAGLREALDASRKP